MPRQRPKMCLPVPWAIALLGSPLAFAPAAQGQHDCGSATLVDGLPFTASPDTAAAPSSTGAGSCNAAGAVLADALNNAVWYRLSPAEDAPVRIAVSGVGYDVISTLWTGSCDALVEIACRDQPEPNEMHIALEGGSTYWLSVGDFGVLPGGGPTTVVIELDPDPLANDVCAGAINVGTLPFTAAIDNSHANATSPAATCNSAAARMAGVLDNSMWYAFTPDSMIDVAVTVTPDDLWDPLVVLLRGGSCGSLTQVACRDVNEPGEAETLRWTAQEGVRYWIVVGDRGTVDGGGPAQLSVTTPLGGCCLSDDHCSMLTGPDCAAAGGLYQGDDSTCAEPGYETASDGCSGFEDISATGAALLLGGDDGATIPITFGFPFFGQVEVEVGVSANGYLSFGGALGDFTNDPIPSTGAPNGVIAPLWCDLSPHLAGAVQHETRGTSGIDLRLIVQWTNVPRFGEPDANTFQAVLFESGDVELRYEAITPEPFPGAYTIGLERGDGLAGVAVDAATVGAGLTCLSFNAANVGADCAAVCLCEFDGVEGVDVFDLLSYLDDWFVGAPRADVDGTAGVDVSDLLVMLDCWFVASGGSQCP